MMARSIVSRKLDLLYLTFFVIHIPIMLLVDLSPLYISFLPAATAPGQADPTSPSAPLSLFVSEAVSKGTSLRTYYAETYQDRFFTDPPRWFIVYLWLEAGYHVPLSVWALAALIRDDHRVPLQLLLFAAEVAMTTLTCVVDMLSWEDVSVEGKWKLSSVYVPYLGLVPLNRHVEERQLTINPAVLMGVDMYSRLQQRLALSAGSTRVATEKKER